ncbi:hypothetical protein [Nocardia nova]|uniref:hypothetical protein n=1 Tax=Nocardia nova TaxID=37330 RepID=UPI0011B056AC|nr:hypothetical protein [Nocardia nova]
MPLAHVLAARSDADDIYHLYLAELARSGPPPGSRTSPRTNCANALVNAGVSLQSLMTLLGYVSAQMSLRYGKLFDTTVRTEYERALTLAKDHLAALQTTPAGTNARTSPPTPSTCPSSPPNAPTPENSPKTHHAAAGSPKPTATTNSSPDSTPPSPTSRNQPDNRETPSHKARSAQISRISL